VRRSAVNYTVAPWLLFALLLASTVPCAGAYIPRKPAQFTFYIENDLVGGTDSDYTSGFRWAWLSRSLRFKKLPLAPRALAQLIAMDAETNKRFSYGLSFMQRIFTPGDIKNTERITEDRPYAGWSGFGFSVHAEDEITITSVGLSAGVVGPLSFARTPQDWFHSATEQPLAQGWQHQLKNEPTFNAHFAQTRRITPLEHTWDEIGADAVCGWELNLGNLFSDARGCAYARCGYNLTPDLALQKAEIHSYNRDLFFAGRPLRNNEWTAFLVLGVEGRWSAYNVFLDGNATQAGHYVDKSTLSGDLSIGAAAGYGRFRAGYLHTFRSREFATQDKGQQFGSFGASWAF